MGLQASCRELLKGHGEMFGVSLLDSVHNPSSWQKIFKVPAAKDIRPALLFSMYDQPDMAAGLPMYIGNNNCLVGQSCEMR